MAQSDQNFLQIHVYVEWGKTRSLLTSSRSPWPWASVHKASLSSQFETAGGVRPLIWGTIVTWITIGKCEEREKWKETDEPCFYLNPRTVKAVCVLQVKRTNSFIWIMSLSETDDFWQIQPTPIWTLHSGTASDLHESTEKQHRTIPLAPHAVSFFFPPHGPVESLPGFAPDSLRVLAGLEPPSPQSLSNSAAAAVWSMIPLIITATLSPLSHHRNWHSQGQLSADCLHRLGLH